MEETKDLRTDNVGLMPAFVRYNTNLSTGAKLMYYELTAQCNENNCSELRDVELMVLFGVTETTIKNWINELVKFGYVNKEMVYYKESKQIVGRKLIIKT